MTDDGFGSDVEPDDAFGLLPESAYHNLPEEDTDRFIALAEVARSNMVRILGEMSEIKWNQSVVEVHRQFIDIVSALADEFTVSGLISDPSEYDNSEQEYSIFSRRLSATIARRRARLGTKRVDEFSVKVGYKTKGWLRQELDHLGIAIDSADIPQAKRDRLKAKLDELIKELDRERVSFSKVMAVAASIAAIFGGGATGLAQAPKALETVHRIIMLIGVDKEAEESERLRLEGPSPTPPPPRISSGTAIASTSTTLTSPTRSQFEGS